MINLQMNKKGKGSRSRVGLHQTEREDVVASARAVRTSVRIRDLMIATTAISTRPREVRMDAATERNVQT